MGQAHPIWHCSRILLIGSLSCASIAQSRTEAAVPARSKAGFLASIGTCTQAIRPYLPSQSVSRSSVTGSIICRGMQSNT